MNDLNKLRALSGIPLDLSKVENAKKTVRIPARIAEQLNEYAKVPSHRGEVSPKTKKNMRDRSSNAKKALESLEIAKECLMSIPAVDYDDTVPKLIKQLHHMMHGEDGTGGVHHEHRKYQKEFDDMEFPEDLENKDPGKDGNPTEKEIAAKEKESAEKKAKSEKKKAVKENAQAIDQEETQAQGIVDDMDGEGADSQEEEERSRYGVSQQARDRMAVMDKESATGMRSPSIALARRGKDPYVSLNKTPTENLTKSDSANDEDDSAMTEASSASKPIFNRNAPMNKMFTQGKTDDQFAADADLTEPTVSTIANDTGVPTNVRTSKQNSLYYPPTSSHDEGPNQMTTNPYNESQKVTVPAKIKSALKNESTLARKEASKYEIRKDWDNKNFYENMANAFEVLGEKLETGTIYSIKEAQIYMTSLMSLYTNKIPPEVIKYIASGGSVRPLKDYLTKVTGDHSEV